MAMPGEACFADCVSLVSQVLRLVVVILKHMQRQNVHKPPCQHQSSLGNLSNVAVLFACTELNSPCHYVHAQSI